MNILRDPILCILVFSQWFKLIGSVPGNLEIRMKKILPYQQNQLEFFQQSGDKLHDFGCVFYIDGPQNDKRVTNSHGPLYL